VRITNALEQPVSGFRPGAPTVEFYDHLEPEVASVVAAALEVLGKSDEGHHVAPTNARHPGDNFFTSLATLRSVVPRVPDSAKYGMDYMPRLKSR